ncbi:MAG: UDP-glucose/GDP-mannose dehydrogenase family protein [Candidatus Latescibacteria bacterium]|nr:UDP-glucose/GDP-mannose dehydrogenase family protein [Candidatus Latescibacterota bacterium]
MNIVMLGTGYVGLVSGTCFAEMGNRVICIDTDQKKIDMLNNGKVPIYEPGLEALIRQNVNEERLLFTRPTSDIYAKADIIFICVGTPQSADGSANLSSVWAAAKDIGDYCDGYTVVVTKSTVPAGTTGRVKKLIMERLSKRASNATIEMANNPEFLKEGNAVDDFMSPDRVVVGADSDRVRKIMRQIYSPFFRTENRVIFMSIASSELTKYASNCMLATRISFMNEIANLAEKVGADVEEIRLGVARDKRIGKYFLYAGAGYGGSCFPKDVSALITTGREYGVEMNIIRAANDTNNRQKRLIAEKVLRFFGNNVVGKRFGIWGLAFKPETDDIRDAPAIEVLRILRKAGAEFAVHDPKALENVRILIGDDGVMYCKNSYEAIKNADALLIMTEWKQYRTPDWPRIKNLMKQSVIFDGRNLFFPEDMHDLGFTYFGIGYGDYI